MIGEIEVIGSDIEYIFRLFVLFDVLEHINNGVWPTPLEPTIAISLLSQAILSCRKRMKSVDANSN